jgi:hypothetical protein
MQAITHFLTGIIIQILCFMYFDLPFNIIFTAIFAFLSHFVVDAFAEITYHTPEPQKGDKFWLTWNILMNVAAIVLAIWFVVLGLFWFYFLGCFFSVLVDIMDWGIIRPIQHKKKKTNTKSIWEEKGYFHNIIDKIREKTLFWLPNWNYKRKGIILEIIIIIILSLIIFFLIEILFSVEYNFNQMLFSGV